MHLVSLCCLLILPVIIYIQLAIVRLYILCCGLSILTGEFMIAFLCMIIIVLERNSTIQSFS